MASAEARKQKNIAALKAREIATLPSLPKIEANPPLRSPQDVARRVLCLGAVADAATGTSRKLVREYVEKYRTGPYLSPEERRFLAKSRATKRESSNFSWRFEAAVPLMWALGKLAHLSPDAQMIRPDVLVRLFPPADKPDLAFINKAKLRPKTQILDFADWVYRAHWAIVEARLTPGTKTGALDGEVVMEWHKAANWLISYQDGAEWDDVATDT